MRTVSAMIAGAALFAGGMAGGLAVAKRPHAQVPPAQKCDLDLGNALREQGADIAQMRSLLASLQSHVLQMDARRGEGERQVPLPTPADPATQTDPPPVAALSSEQSAAAYARFTEIIDHALAVRRWTAADQRAASEVMHVLRADQRRQLVTRLFTAVNAQQLTLETPHLL